MTEEKRIMENILIIQKCLSNPDLTILSGDSKVMMAYGKGVVDMIDNILEDFRGYLKEKA